MLSCLCQKKHLSLKSNDWRISSQFGITYALPDVAGQFGGGPENTTTFERRAIPEPGTWLLVPTAVGLAWLARKKRKANREDALRPYGAA